MDLERALEIVWIEVERRGQNRVADLLSVASSTLTKWRKGSRPEGDVKARVIGFAEQSVAGKGGFPPMWTAGTSTPNSDVGYPGAVMGGGSSSFNSYELGVIAGQAKAVRRFLESAIAEQDRVLAGLARLAERPTSTGVLVDEVASVSNPPVSRAKLDETVRRQLAKDAEDARRRRGTG
jgi:hypothetical protein